MDGTNLQQGRFLSDGTSRVLKIRSDVDWMRVLNIQVADEDQTTAVGVEFFWQRGMDDGAGIEYKKADTDNTANMVQRISFGGFTLIDTSDQKPGALNETITAVSSAAIPVVTNSGVNGLSAGDVVRMIDVTGAQQLGGFDFTVGNETLSDTTFSLDYMTQIDAGTTGSWRKINFDPMFYPTRRTITKITASDSTLIQFSVKHGYTIGQYVKLEIPVAYGMQELNGLKGKILRVDTDTNMIALDIDSSGFSAFAFPLTTDVPFSKAEVIPIGRTATEDNSNNFDGSVENISYIGMELGAGIHGPSGVSGDGIYWRSGKSLSVNNEK